MNWSRTPKTKVKSYRCFRLGKALDDNGDSFLNDLLFESSIITNIHEQSYNGK